MPLITVFGVRGSGKTTLIAGQIPDMKKPIIIVDILGNEKFDVPGAVHVDQIPEAINELAKSFEEPKHSQIIVLRTADYNAAIDWACAALRIAKGGTLVIDEGDAFDIPEAPCFDESVRYGRNWGVSMVVGCRRPAEISKNITANANKIYCFITHEPNDLKYFTPVFGDKADELLSLPQFHGIFIDYDKGQIGNFYIDEQGKIFHTKAESIYKKSATSPKSGNGAEPELEPRKLEENQK
jgi:hypothetical protein